MAFLTLRRPSILAYGSVEPGEKMNRQTLEDLAALACIVLCMTAWMFV